MIAFLVKRPIGTTMIYIALAVLGILAAKRLPVSLMPGVDIPEITVQANYQNYTARQMEQLVMAPLRNELLQVLHLEDIRSEARNGQGTIVLRFDYGAKVDHAAIEVNEKIDRVLSRLPGDISRPKVIKASAIDMPVFTLNLALKDQDENEERFLQLSEFAEMVIKRRIEQLPQVALVDISGLSFPEIQIVLDTSRVVQLDIGFREITNAILENNRTIGNIIVRDGYYQYNVKIANRLVDISDLENILIRSKGRIFTLRELASIEIVPKGLTGLYQANGDRAIALAVIKKSSARMEDMATHVKTAVGQLENDYPEITFELTRDQSSLLTVTISSLQSSLFIGSLLAFFVLFFFLRDLRAPFLIGLSVPVSIIISMLCFRLLGLSINVVSLSGLLLGVGMMIDNSIIVIDNISQLIDRGASLAQACARGAEEVFRPLLSSVLTTCAVFVPLIYLSGISGALFYDQAIAVTIGLSVSLGVAVTLIPVYFHVIYKNKRLKKWNEQLNPFRIFHLEGAYKKGYQWVITHQRIMVFLFIIILAAAWPLYDMIDKKRFPSITEPATELSIDWNEDLHVEENQKRIDQLLTPVIHRLRQYNGFIGQQQFLLSGSQTSRSGNEAFVYLLAENESQIAAIKMAISERLTQAYPRATFQFARPSNAFERIFVSDQAPLTALIKMTGDQGGATDGLLPLQNALLSTFSTTQPIPMERVIEIHLNHENLLLYNVEVNSVIDKLRTLLNENTIGELKYFQKFVEIKAAVEDTDFLATLTSATLSNREGSDIPLKYLLSTAYSEDLKQIHGTKDGVFYPFDFNIAAHEAESYMRRIARIADQFQHVQITFEGGIFSNEQLVHELAVVLVISLVLLYFILAAQFESVWQPLIILAEVPLNISAALAGLYFTGHSLNLMSLIGMVVMSGVIVNDSILKIDTINQLRKEGYAVDQAVATGGERRLKPILMTSLTTILALVPFLVAGGLGAELQRPLAIAVISGMLSGTFVSLYYIPLFYRWIEKK